MRAFVPAAGVPPRPQAPAAMSRARDTPHTSTPLTFAGAESQALAARVDAPAGPARAHAVLAHCFTCGKDIRAAVTISGALAGAGIAVRRSAPQPAGRRAGD